METRLPIAAPAAKQDLIIALSPISLEIESAAERKSTSAKAAVLGTAIHRWAIAAPVSTSVHKAGKSLTTRIK